MQGFYFLMLRLTLDSKRTDYSSNSLENSLLRRLFTTLRRLYRNAGSLRRNVGSLHAIVGSFTHHATWIVKCVRCTECIECSMFF